MIKDAKLIALERSILVRQTDNLVGLSTDRVKDQVVLEMLRGILNTISEKLNDTKYIKRGIFSAPLVNWCSVNILDDTTTVVELQELVTESEIFKNISEYFRSIGYTVRTLKDYHGFKVFVIYIGNDDDFQEYMRINNLDIIDLI